MLGLANCHSFENLLPSNVFAKSTRGKLTPTATKPDATEPHLWSERYEVIRSFGRNRKLKWDKEKEGRLGQTFA